MIADLWYFFSPVAVPDHNVWRSRSGNWRARVKFRISDVELISRFQAADRSQDVAQVSFFSWRSGYDVCLWLAFMHPTPELYATDARDMLMQMMYTRRISSSLVDSRPSLGFEVPLSNLSDVDEGNVNVVFTAGHEVRLVTENWREALTISKMNPCPKTNLIG